MKIDRRRLMAGGLGGLIAPALVTRANAAPRTHAVAIRGFAFDPAGLTVQAGDHVRFTNHDLAPHTATARDGSWDTGTLETGQSVELDVSDVWSGDYFCAYHPAMTARLSIG